MDRATVRSKFAMVKHVDRVGRLADTLEFVDLALPRERFSAELLEQLRELAPSMISRRRPARDPPLLRRAADGAAEPLPRPLVAGGARGGGVDYGNAIRDLACANIFPGDMLWRNFGVTSYGRVVFYDYDEIEYLSDVNFRRIPEAPDPESELSAEPWYGVERNDVFPRSSGRSCSATRGCASSSSATTPTCSSRSSGSPPSAGTSVAS